MTPRETTPSSDPDIRRAWRALRALDGVRGLPSKVPADPDAITELLFDHAHRFDSSRFLYLLTNLQIDRMDIAARAFCLEQALLLDPGLLAEETLCVLFHELLEGERTKPFPAWARRAMERAANDAVEQPGIAPPRELGRNPIDRRLARELAPGINQLELSSRRILWLHLVDGADAHAIARTTGQPFELIEFVLARHVDPARAALASGPSRKSSRRADDSRPAE